MLFLFVLLLQKLPFSLGSAARRCSVTFVWCAPSLAVARRRLPALVAGDIAGEDGAEQTAA